MDYILEPHDHLLATAQDVLGADLVTEAWIVYPTNWPEQAISALRDSIRPCGDTKEFYVDDAEIVLGFTNGRRILLRARTWAMLRDITGDNQYLDLHADVTRMSQNYHTWTKTDWFRGTAPEPPLHVQC